MRRKVQSKQMMSLKTKNTLGQGVILFATSCGRPWITGNFLQVILLFSQLHLLILSKTVLVVSNMKVWVRNQMWGSYNLVFKGCLHQNYSRFPVNIKISCGKCPHSRGENNALIDMEANRTMHIRISGSSPSSFKGSLHQNKRVN